MPNILLERSHSGWLTPYDAESEEYMRGWKPGKVLEANVRFVRDPIQHRKTMLLIHKLWLSGVIEANSMDAAIEIAKLVVGFVEVRKTPPKPLGAGPGYYTVPRSISYANADEQVYRQEFAEPLRIEARKLLDMDDPNVRNEFEGLL